MSDNYKYPRIQRNVIFCGETGMGKSSAINLLLETASATVSNGSQPCTKVSANYQTVLNGIKYNLWDTRGLGEARSILQAVFGWTSEKNLKKFLKERHQKHELDLLVYCVRGSRATTASAKYYNTFCAVTRRLAAPVVIAVTHLEREEDMDNWWNRNFSDLKELEMEFDGHACITTLTGHPRLAESKEKLVSLITRSHRWEAKDSGHYFGSLVQKPTPPTPPRRGGIPSLLNLRGRGGVGNADLDRRPSNYSGSPSIPSSTRDSSYHTAESPRESVPPSPTVEPPTPRTPTALAKTPLMDTDLLRGGDPSPSTSGETSSMRSSLHSMFYPSPPSSYTSNSEVQLQFYTEENEDHSNELPFKFSTATVRRRQSYPTRSGGFGDIWECELISEESSRMVAVKAVRTDANDNKDLKKKLHREWRVWERLQHKNVVPLLGLVSGFGPLPSMVSPWFRNGSLSHYLAYHPSLGLSEKHRLLKDIAAGLCYLHSQGVIHGDLHSDNVLIDEDGTACLTDFGLSLIKDFVGTSYLKSSICGGVQFADPALVQRIDSSQDIVFYPTKPCDVYSFGGLMLHVLSGKKPYEEIHSTPAIFLAVLKGKRPRIPPRDRHFTQWHESVIQKCWDPEACQRPLAEYLVKLFGPQ